MRPGARVGAAVAPRRSKDACSVGRESHPGAAETLGADRGTLRKAHETESTVPEGAVGEAARAFYHPA